MDTLKFKILILFIGLGFFTQCEKDDICISSVEGTPDLIVLMLENENNTQKKPTGFTIRPLGTKNILAVSSGDSLALPLQITEAVTQFEFILNQGSQDENIDTLQINYQRVDQFINRACGYRANFTLDQSPILILNSGNNWIKGAVILKDTISDETAAHLGILF